MDKVWSYYTSDERNGTDVHVEEKWRKDAALLDTDFN